MNIIHNKALRKLIFEKRPPRGWVQDMALRRWTSPKGRFCVTAKEVYLATVFFTCAVCGDGPDEDIRHISIDCFYAVEEVSPKFVRDEKTGIYRIQVCKGCRARFLFHHLADFIDTKGRLADERIGSDGILEL